MMNGLGKKVLCLLTIAAASTTVSASAKDSPALELARQLNDAFTEIADKASPAVVVIKVSEKPDDTADDGSAPSSQTRRYHHSRQPKVYGQGSGIILSEDGYILTNDHVVDNADGIEVILKDGTVFHDVELKGSDPESDIAVLKIPAKHLTPAKLGDSDKTRVGEFVLAIGAPFDLSYTVTVGHISAKGRSFRDGGYSDQDFLQTDASINPGNSGGPLVNLYGEVIGINAMIEGMNTGIGFAIPITLAKRVASQLIAHGKYNRLIIGVEIGNLNEYKDALRLQKDLVPDADQGVVIEGIRFGSPAARSKLKAGDVVVGVDGKPVESEHALKNEIASKNSGQSVTLNVVRGKEHLAVKVEPEPLHADDTYAAGVPATHPADNTIESSSGFGLKVAALTKRMAHEFGVAPGVGVVVSAVEGNSIADDYGIKKGDVITEVNRNPVRTLQEFRDALKSATPRSGVALSLISDTATRFIILRDDAP
jgi:serine protease Do